MALTTYTTLSAAIASWLERSDLTSQIPDFISLTESRLNRMLNIRSAETTATLTGVTSSRTIALPTGFREPLNLWRVPSSGQRDPLRMVPADLMTVDTTSGQPEQWSIDGANVAFERPCDQAYSFALRYMGALDLATTLTNLVLTQYPDLYLFGACCEAGPFLRDGELLAMFDARFQAALSEAKSKESRIKSMVTLSSEVSEIAGRDRRSSFNINRGY